MRFPSISDPERGVVDGKRMVGAGVDVSATTFHAVVVGDGEVAMSTVWPADDPDGLVELFTGGGVSRVAIDSPAARSLGHHVDDELLGAKFRPARCGEIALGREHRIWVPWVPPMTGDAPGWMEAGFALFLACEAAGLDAVETYPHAVFRALAGGARLPKKTTASGISARVALLAGRVGVEHLAMWSHDALDAAACTVVAADPGAVAVTCGHDDSAIWLPSAR